MLCPWATPEAPLWLVESCYAVSGASDLSIESLIVGAPPQPWVSLQAS